MDCASSVASAFGYQGASRSLAFHRRTTRAALIGTSVDRPLVLLRVSPLHAIHHFARLGRDLIEVTSQPAVVDGQLIAINILQDDNVNLVSLKETHLMSESL